MPKKIPRVLGVYNPSGPRICRHKKIGAALLHVSAALHGGADTPQDDAVDAIADLLHFVCGENDDDSKRAVDICQTALSHYHFERKGTKSKAVAGLPR